MANLLPPLQTALVDKDGVLNSVWYSWFLRFSEGFSGTIVTAKITGGGANGSMTFENGVLISQVDAT